MNGFAFKLTLLPLIMLIMCGWDKTISYALSNAEDEKNFARTISVINTYLSRDLMVKALLADSNEVLLLPTQYTSYKVGAPEDVAQQVREKLKGATNFDRPIKASEYVTEIANALVGGTEFTEKINVNGVFNKNYLNIYFLKEDPEGLVPDAYFKNNCSYIAGQRTIVCDGLFVRQRLDRLANLEKFYSVAIVDIRTGNLLKPTELDRDLRKKVNTMLRSSFLTWFLGHEIGHAVDHSYQSAIRKSAHFDEIQFDKSELEADLFVAKILSVNPSLAAGFWTGIGEFIEQEYRSMYFAAADAAKSAASDPNEELFPLNYPLEINHCHKPPPLLIRALRIIEVLTKLTPELDTTGYYKDIIANVKISSCTSLKRVVK